MSDKEPADHLDLGKVDSDLRARMSESRPELRLEPVRRALEILGNPHDMYGIIHITGTNGKTSTARITESLLSSHGLRVGLMTSPHMRSVAERIRIDGEQVSDHFLASNWQDIEPVLELVDQELSQLGQVQLTFFEALTVLTFACFSDAPVDVAVVEVGMGGEWDATNVVNPDVCVFTPIAMDHSEYLGESIGKIAATKAGIIKPGSQVVSAPQNSDASEAIRKASEVTNSTLLTMHHDFTLKSSRVAVGGQQISVAGLSREYDDLTLPLLGSHQAENAALAIAAVELFFGGATVPLSEEVVEEGIRSASSPGRLQVIDQRPTVIVDSAHNPHGAQALSKALKDLFVFPRIACVLSIFRGKDVPGIVDALADVVDFFVVTESDSDRSVPLQELADQVSELIGFERVRAHLEATDALGAARRLAGLDGGVLITGSISLVGRLTSEKENG